LSLLYHNGFLNNQKLLNNLKFSDLSNISKKKLFPVSSMGSMAINLIMQ